MNDDTNAKILRISQEFLSQQGPCTEDILLLSVNQRLLAEGLRQQDFSRFLPTALENKKLFLTSDQLISAESRTGRLNVYRLKRVLEAIKKPKQLHNFCHAMRLFEESDYLLAGVQGRADAICEQYSKTTRGAVYTNTLERLPNFEFTTALKAFHFNLRAFLDEILRILNQLAFIYVGEGQRLQCQPSTNYSKFYQQYSERKLDDLDINIVKFIYKHMADFSASRFLRNNLKLGAQPVYSRCSEKGNAYLRCEVSCIKQNDDVMDDIIKKGLIQGKKVIGFQFPDGPKSQLKIMRHFMFLLYDVLMFNFNEDLAASGTE